MRATADIVVPVARFVRVSLGSCLGCLFGTGEKLLPQEDVGESVSHDKEVVDESVSERYFHLSFLSLRL